MDRTTRRRPRCPLMLPAASILCGHALGQAWPEPPFEAALALIPILLCVFLVENRRTRSILIAMLAAICGVLGRFPEPKTPPSRPHLVRIEGQVERVDTWRGAGGPGWQMVVRCPLVRADSEDDVGLARLLARVRGSSTPRPLPGDRVRVVGLMRSLPSPSNLRSSRLGEVGVEGDVSA